MVVTEFGPVPVSWKRQNNELAFRFEVPKGIKSMLRLADGDPSSLVLDGQRTQTRVQERYVTIVTGAGVHEGRLMVKPPPAAPVDATVIEQRLSEEGRSHWHRRPHHRHVARRAGSRRDQGRPCSHRIGHRGRRGSRRRRKKCRRAANGTTKNGAGGGVTLNDGQTFRGYGTGSVVTFQLDGAHNLTGVRTFAGHGDSRAARVTP